MAKRFFFVCLGILCLALAYHLGANNASAQGSSGKVRLIAAAGDNAWVVTDTDDIYLVKESGTPSVAHGDGWSRYRLGVLK
jgi:hypothetical protein